MVVGNGCEPAGVPDGARVVALPVDEGIPAGRNAGVPHTAGELLLFLDDDARLAEPDALARVAARVRRRPGARAACSSASRRPTAARPAATGCRACASATRAAPSEITVVWEGAVAMPRACSSGSAAGRPTSASCTRASTSAGASWTPGSACATRATSSRCTPRGRAGHTAHQRRERAFVLFRGAQPRLARAPPPAAAAGRPLRDRLRAAHGAPPADQAGAAGSGAGVP